MEEAGLLFGRIVDFFKVKWERALTILLTAIIAGILTGSFYLVFGVTFFALLVAFVLYLVNGTV